MYFGILQKHTRLQIARKANGDMNAFPGMVGISAIFSFLKMKMDNVR